MATRTRAYRLCRLSNQGIEPWLRFLSWPGSPFWSPVAQEAAAGIRAATGNPAVDVFAADMSVQAEVRRLAAQVADTYPRLDVLVSSRRLGTWLARDKGGSAPEHLTGDDEGTLSMWAFFSRRLRMWLLLAIALPLTRALVHRLALAAEHRDPSTRTAKALHQADSTVTAVSRRAARKAERRKAER